MQSFRGLVQGSERAQGSSNIDPTVELISSLAVTKKTARQISHFRTSSEAMQWRMDKCLEIAETDWADVRVFVSSRM